MVTKYQKLVGKNLLAAGDMFPDLLSDSQKSNFYELEAKSKVLTKSKKIVVTEKSKIVVTENKLIVPTESELAVYEDSKFDIVALMDSATDPLTGQFKDLKIDDRDLTFATNFFDFSVNLVGKASSIPWARQLAVCLIGLGQCCTYCTKPKYLNINNIPKDADINDVKKVLVLLNHGVCRKCKRTKYDLIKNHNLRDYQQIVLCLGQRSGKSAISALIAAYLTHSYLMFPSLASVARKEMQAATQLTGLFVSLTFSKAVGVLWTPYKKIIEQSTWFEQHNAMLNYHGAKYGTKLYNVSTLFIDYPYKNMRFYPSGPKFSTLRGSTSLFNCIDELSLFPLPSGDQQEDETSERANADEMHKSLTRSLTTVSNIRNRLIKEGISAAPACILTSVSSPISQRDKTMRLITQSKTPEGLKYIYAVQLATWDMNPNIQQNDPIIELAHSENAEKCDRDYGANPPSVQSPFMRSPDLQDIFINGQNSHNLKYCYDRPGELYGVLDKIRSIKWPSLITIDAGAVNNSFCIIAGHYDFDQQKTVVSTIIECMPHENRRINFNLIYENVIKVLTKDLHGIAVLADKWQSIDILHRIKDDMGNNPLQKPKVLSKQYSPNRRDFDVLLSMCRNKNLIFPSILEVDKEKIDTGNVENYKVDMLNRPIAHLYLQLMTIKDIGENKCPTKGDGMTDDIARALVLFASKLHNPVIMARLKEAIPWVNTVTAIVKPMPMPGFRPRAF